MFQKQIKTKSKINTYKILKTTYPIKLKKLKPKIKKNRRKKKKK